ncbi:MAG: PepSY domain-containing protein [Akkermansiaceae bacterium]
MRIQWPRLNRKVHYWSAIICAVPVLIVIITGILLLLKKESAWIQPPSQKGSTGAPTLSYESILATAVAVPEAEIASWDDVSRLDIRPGKGLIKVMAKNHWEIQLDHQSGTVLQVAYRRSDVIESLHDGSFFHDYAKLGVFLPSAIVLLLLWITGIYLFVKPLLVKRSRKQKVRSREEGV